jgi:serine phosphatase RsbU (regulator of sigma subunit)
MAVLRVISGLRTGEKLLVGDDGAVLGRHPDCNIVLDSAAVSRQHAKISRERGSHYYLEDLGSRNGTYLNNRRIQGRELLREGDRVDICDLAFHFYLTDPDTRPTETTPSSDSSLPLLVDDAEDEKPSSSTVMSKLDLSSSQSSLSISVKPEVKLKAMMEIAQNLRRSLSLQEVLGRLLDSLFKIFLQADRGFVVLASLEDGTLVPMAVKYRRSDDEQRARISRTIMRDAMEGKRAVLSADAASDERFSMAQSIADFQIRSLMCAPLLNSEEKALGVIQIDTLSQRTRFTQDDLEVLASVASQAAVAVENAQLHEQTLRQEVLEREMEVARRVQQGLLPEKMPEVAGYDFFHYYESARQVGGDFLDYVRLAGGRWAIVVADVAGKGVAAALLMAKLSGELRSHLASEPDLLAAISHINRSFKRPEWEDRFVTLVAVVLDPASHHLTLVNAGHMAPLLRNGAGEVQSIGEDGVGPPLGVVDGFPYTSATHVLAPGDILTLFTDGISEAMNARGEIYGLQNLCKQVGAPTATAADLAQLILGDVRRFVHGHPQSDDMCLACFGRRGD